MTKNYQAEIVAVGTELLLGQIANTNAQWLSEQLATYGINVYNHTVVGDNLDRVEQAFRLAQSRSDIVIVTGGLGPTEDDLTREGFEQLTGLEIIEDKTTMEKIESYYKERNRTMTPNNRKQARVFKGASVLKNNAGMAPGMYIDYRGYALVLSAGRSSGNEANFFRRAVSISGKLNGKTAGYSIHCVEIYRHRRIQSGA